MLDHKRVHVLNIGSLNINQVINVDESILDKLLCFAITGSTILAQ